MNSGLHKCLQFVIQCNETDGSVVMSTTNLKKWLKKKYSASLMRQ
jgi:hypothetical protein